MADMPVLFSRRRSIALPGPGWEPEGTADRSYTEENNPVSAGDKSKGQYR